MALASPESGSCWLRPAGLASRVLPDATSGGEPYPECRRWLLPDGTLVNLGDVAFRVADASSGSAIGRTPPGMRWWPGGLPEGIWED
ncbi:hypothetical protein EI545_13980 [Tabrizicola piscis]|uniref:Uncharacterized protein n=1 Tax=Tabrizicola piscis TaxID=2494374 RepID=A0A3S8U859_9RHOB|nr:hypothetical protein [Tabrizicola piscis]AZL59846.1 hypothetical protein EI545_13980 [Tabrizicola piscis]